MAFNRFIINFKQVFNTLENNFLAALLGKPPTAVCPVLSLPPPNSEGVLDFLKDSILFAVPKSRRTLEKRKARKFGRPEYVWKPYVPKKNLIMCKTCGNSHELGILCAHCYERIKLETEEMQKAIEASENPDTVEKDVIVVYENEINEKSEEFWKGKRVVEMKKKRPEWFSDNLLEKSTSRDTPTENVKPTELA